MLNSRRLAYHPDYVLRPEVNVKPWVSLKKELEEGNNMTAWIEREPYAYWKGNTRTGIGRRDLFKCNPWHPHDWYARIFHQVWKLPKF